MVLPPPVKTFSCSLAMLLAPYSLMTRVGYNLNLSLMTYYCYHSLSRHRYYSNLCSNRPIIAIQSTLWLYNQVQTAKEDAAG